MVVRFVTCLTITSHSADDYIVIGERCCCCCIIEICCRGFSPILNRFILILASFSMVVLVSIVVCGWGFDFALVSIVVC